MQPTAVYENLDIPGIKNQVQKDVKPLAGIYFILNLVNGKIYLSSACSGRMSNPPAGHKHLYGFNGNKPVANAVKKYGLHNFAFIVLETLASQGVVTQKDNLILLEMENLYIKQLAPDYNIAPQAGNSFGYKHTEETKLNMKENYSYERRERIGSLNRGKRLSPETVVQMRESALSRKPMSEETRKKKFQRIQLRRITGMFLNQILRNLEMQQVAVLLQLLFSLYLVLQNFVM